MNDYHKGEKVNEIYNRVIDVLKNYNPTEACNALSMILAHVLSAHCIVTGVECKPLLENLFDDIRNITELDIKERMDEEIKVEI